MNFPSTPEPEPRAITLGASSERRPHVVLLGGQDAPSAQVLQERWKRSLSGLLPRHDLTVIQWPNPRTGCPSALERAEILPSPSRAATRARKRQGPFDRIAAHTARRVIRGLDKYVRFDCQGRARSLFGRAIYHYTKFSVDALYDRGGFGSALVSLAAQALSESHVDLVVAHSFGGTIALRAAWALQERRSKSAPFALLTLGTASGYTVERAPMFAPFWSTRDQRGIMRSQQVASWQHFYSKSDAIVGSGQMPRSFLGVDLVNVHTGRFLQRGFGHALSGYLAAPAVRSAIAMVVQRASVQALPASTG